MHFGAQRDDAAAAGMIPGGAALGDRRGHGRAGDGFQRGQHVGFERRKRRRHALALAPVALAVAGADAGGDGLLRAGHAAVEGGADLEQQQVGEAARGVARRGRQQRRQQRRAQRIEIGGDGIGQLARIIAAAEQRGLVARDEAEADALVEAARGNGAARGAACGAALCDSTGAATAWSRRSATDGTSDRPWMRTTSSTRSAGPSTSWRQVGGVTCSVAMVFDHKAQALQDLDDARARHARCRPAFPPARDRRRWACAAAAGAPAITTSDGLAAAPVQDQLGREFEARQHELRIDAALEAVARVGDDAVACGPARATRTGSKQADSRNTLTVSS